MYSHISRPHYLPEVPPSIDYLRTHAQSDDRVTFLEASEDIHFVSPKHIMDFRNRYGRAVAFNNAGALTYFLSSPAAVRDVLIAHPDDFLKGEQEAAISNAIGWGLLTDEGKVHKRRSRAYGPALRDNSLQGHRAEVSRVASLHVGHLGSVRQIGLLEWTRNFAQHVAEATLFNRDDHQVNYRYQEAVLDVNDIVMAGVDPGLDGQQAVRRIKETSEALSFVRSYTSGLISGVLEGPAEGAALLDHIMREDESAGNAEGDVSGQFAVFLQAAVETTSSLISWTLILLSENPSYLVRLRKELAEVNDSADSRSSTESRPLLRAVIMESLRLYPPTWLIPRIATRPVRVDDISIPVGARVNLSPWVTHRDEEVYQSPERFDPERWLGDSAVQPPAGGYFPFGLGKRICIGERYAKNTARIFLDEILARPEFHITGNHPLEVGPASLIAIPSREVTFSF